MLKTALQTADTVPSRIQGEHILPALPVYGRSHLTEQAHAPTGHAVHHIIGTLLSSPVFPCDQKQPVPFRNDGFLLFDAAKISLLSHTTDF